MYRYERTPHRTSLRRRRLANAASEVIPRDSPTIFWSFAAASQLWVRQRIARLRRAVADGGGGGGGALGRAAARAPPRLGLATAPAGLLSCLCLGGAADDVDEPTVTI